RHDLGGIHPTGMPSGVVRAGDGGLPVEAGILDTLAAKLPQVPWGFSGQTLFVESVPRAGAE
ncbi:MAG: hypothetical protein AAB425_08460, partial [Bdellovibrionota bacterium]